MAVFPMVKGVPSGGSGIDLGRPSDKEDNNFSVNYNAWSNPITTTKKPRYIAITFNRANIGDGSVWLIDTKNETVKKIGYNGGFQYADVTYSDIIQFESDTSFKIKGQGGSIFDYQIVWWYE